MEVNTKPTHYCEFRFNDRSSLDYGMRIKFPFDINSPASDRAPTQVPGLSGDINAHENSYRAVDVVATTSIFIPKKYNSWYELKTTIERWLLSGGRGLLKITDDEKYIYEAEVDQAIQFQSNSPDRVTATITWHMQPYKIEIDTFRWQNLPRGSVIYQLPQTDDSKQGSSENNTSGTDATSDDADAATPDESANGEPKNTAYYYNDGDDTAFPDWHLKGQGNFMLMVNDMPYEFDDLDGDLYLYGMSDNAYSYDIEHPDKFDTLELLNTHIRLANNVSPQLLCSGTGKNSISLTPMDTESKLDLIEFRPKLRGLI